MLDDLAIGVGITLVSILISGLALWAAEAFFIRHHAWLREPPHGVRLVAVVMVTAGLVLVVIAVAVTIWAATFHALRLFPDWETALYFALVSYATLGYGDVVAPPGWRILGAMAGANGFLNFGLLTTLLIDGLGHVREGYREARRDRPVSAARRSGRRARPDAPPPATED
jgi:hypothetical protein